MNHDALRKAAVLIGALDHRSADALLDQMPDEQAALVRRAVMELESVDDDEQETVIGEFLQPDTHDEIATDEGVELALSGRATETVTYEPQRGPMTDESVTLRHLERVDTHQLVALLSHEHPQTTAVIASQLPPGRASELLLALPEDVQTEVVRRIAMLGETDPEIVREIQEAINERLLGNVAPEACSANGLTALHAILAATDDQKRDGLVAKLAGHDPQLVQQLGFAPESARSEPPKPDGSGEPRWPISPESPAPTDPSPTGTTDILDLPRETSTSAPPVDDASPDVALELTFAELATLDDQSLATVFDHALPETAIIALAGADHALVDRILGHLSSRQARRLQRQMCQLGPIRLRDIEHAQQTLARLASDLYRQRSIAPPPATRHIAAAA